MKIVNIIILLVVDEKNKIVSMFDWYVPFTHQSVDDNHPKRVYNQFGGAQANVPKIESSTIPSH